MLRLTLWNSAEDDQHTIDLYDHAPVNLNYQFADVTQINKTAGSYSQTFRIPATHRNRNFFGAIDQPNIQDTSNLINGNYSVKRKIRAEISYNSIPLMAGYVQVKAVYIQKKNFADIELIFFGETIDLAKSLQEKKLADLDTSGIDHTLNYANVRNSWDETLESGNVVYGVIDKGGNWSFDTGGNTPWTSSDGMWQGELTPFVKAKYLVDAIFEEAGFTYSSTLFDSTDFGDIFLCGYNGLGRPRSDDNSSEREMAGAGLLTSFTLLGHYQKLPLYDTAAIDGYDWGSNFDGSGASPSFDYTAPYTATFTFEARLQVSATSGTHTARLVHNTTEVVNWEAGLQGNTITFSLVMVTGDTLHMEAKQHATAANAISGNGVGSNSGTWLRCIEISEPLSGQTIDVAGNLPDVKQIDFLMTLQKLYNLVFVPDPNKPKHLIVEPFNDYLDTGTAKDWTNKIDYTKDVVIRPTTDIQKNVYEWTNDAGQDFINVAVQDSVGRVYGRYRVEDQDNDFATGSETIRTSFAPYIMSLIPNSVVGIHRCIDKDGEGVKSPKGRLAYYNGKTTAYGTWYLRDDSNTTQSQTDFPHFSNYDAVLPSVDDNDLNFGYERAFIQTNAHPLNTMYYRNWMNYVNELYSADSRLLTAYFNLNRADIHDFEFSDKIYIKDTNYRVLKIHNYDATQGGAVRVDLIKILSDINDCADTPTGQNSNGVITFNNSAIDYGSKECCERYGYSWFPDKAGGNSRCYPQSQNIQPT